MPHGLVDDARFVDLFTDRFVLLVSADNDAIGDSMTVQEMIKAPMVVAYNTRTGRNTAVHQMQLAGLEPTVDTVTESFLIVPFLIAGTDRDRPGSGNARPATARVGRCPGDSLPVSGRRPGRMPLVA